MKKLVVPVVWSKRPPGMRMVGWRWVGRFVPVYEPVEEVDKEKALARFGGGKHQGDELGGTSPSLYHK